MSKNSMSSEVTVELISSYKPVPRGIEHDDGVTPAYEALLVEYGGFHPEKRTLVPMRIEEGLLEVHYVLDNITAAVEAGIVDSNSWSSQLFATKDDLETFLDELESYDECYRITDRWWVALAKLVGTVDEEGFIGTQDMAYMLRESIDEGALRRIVLKAQAVYFAVTPLKNPRVTQAQQRALYAHNQDCRAAFAKKGLAKDVSVDFAFPNPYLFIKGKTLFARQVTAADARDLVAKPAPSLPQSAANKKTHATTTKVKPKKQSTVAVQLAG